MRSAHLRLALPKLRLPRLDILAQAAQLLLHLAQRGVVRLPVLRQQERRVGVKACTQYSGVEPQAQRDNRNEAKCRQLPAKGCRQTASQIPAPQRLQKLRIAAHVWSPRRTSLRAASSCASEAASASPSMAARSRASYRCQPAARSRLTCCASASTWMEGAVQGCAEDRDWTAARASKPPAQPVLATHTSSTQRSTAWCAPRGSLPLTGPNHHPLTLALASARLAKATLCDRQSVRVQPVSSATASQMLSSAGIGTAGGRPLGAAAVDVTVARLASGPLLPAGLMSLRLRCSVDGSGAVFSCGRATGGGGGWGGCSSERGAGGKLL